uniref:ATP synthase subunit b, chloroplastic n=1 Tax=Ophidocladus simpliciusculus TaxID=1261574 RepID=A0A1Z1MJ59_9FLOR|nr:ATP synthase CF0 subunit I [Ophidocladus simpliciusculus]ARW65986.1 ATP synthase CF0 subunit I [Ophidocladus simpliciusculus]
MEIFEIFSQGESKALISFNTDFLEANVLNIGVLLFGLIYVLKKFLGSILSDRQSKILFAIRECEERLDQADIRLHEAEKQLTQTKLIIDQIIREAEITARRVRESILEQGKFDIDRLISSSKASINFAENQVRLQIQQQVTALAIKKVSIKLQSQMNPKIQNQIIDQNIMQLQGKINL